MRNNFYKIIILLLIFDFIFWLSFSKPLSGVKIKHQSYSAWSECMKYSGEVTRALSDQIEDQLQLSGGGIARFKDDIIEEFDFNFQTSRHATIEEARALHQYTTTRILQEINRHEKLRPFLEEIPFTYKRISLRIFFSSEPACLKLGVTDISNASDLAVEENRNQLFYSGTDAFEMSRNVHFLKESQEEAARLAKNIPIEDLVTHKSTVLEEALDKILPDFVKRMHHEYQFRYVTMGACGLDSIEDVAMTFTIYRRALREDAREILLDITEQLLDLLSRDEDLRPYFQGDRFPLEKIRLRFQFRKDYGFSYWDGSVDEMTLKDSSITYYQDEYDESTYIGHTSRLEETYEEALQHVMNCSSGKKRV